MVFVARALIFLSIASPLLANREGFADARAKAERLERRGEWAAAAAWWEGAAVVLEAASLPLAALASREAVEDGDRGAVEWWTLIEQVDSLDVRSARERGRAAAEKGGGVSEEERQRMAQEMEIWIAAEVDRWWAVERFDLRTASRLSAGDARGAKFLEARARERWAARYEAVCVAWWSGRDDRKAAAFRGKAAAQRGLAAAAREEMERLPSPLEAWRRARASGDREGAARAAEAMERGADGDALRAAVADLGGEDVVEFAVRLGRIRDAEGLTTLQGVHPELGIRIVQSDRRHPEWFAILGRELNTGNAARSEFAERVLGDWTSGPAREWSVWLAEGSGPGLDVEFFSDTELGAPAGRLIWEDVDADWGLGQPTSRVQPDGWSLRASGFLRVQEKTVAELNVHADDALRVRIDGRTVLDEWTAVPERRIRRAPVSLAPGWHSLVLEYADRSEIAAVRAWLDPKTQPPTPLGPLLRRIPPEVR